MFLSSSDMRCHCKSEGVPHSVLSAQAPHVLCDRVQCCRVTAGTGEALTSSGSMSVKQNKSEGCWRVCQPEFTQQWELEALVRCL